MNKTMMKIEELEQQVAALTKENESHVKTIRGQGVLLDASREQLAASQAREQKFRGQLQRVVGSHNPPNDCYATGPLTGNEVEDLVSCPSCEADALLALPADDTALQARLKEEREKCIAVVRKYLCGPFGQEIEDAIRRMT